MYDMIVGKGRSCGQIQIYTGCGKGKTTAALGLAFRALGQGKSVLLIQFLKKGNHLGELKAARRFKRLKIVQTGCSGLVKRSQIGKKDRDSAQKGLILAGRAVKNKKFDLVILDELNVAIYLNLVKTAAVKEILRSKAEETEIVITGRHADAELIKAADLVSEIKEIKHYYRRGLKARRGIEF